VTSSAIGGWLRCRGTAGGAAARRIWISLGLPSLSSEKGDDQLLQQERLGQDLTGLGGHRFELEIAGPARRTILIVMLLAQESHREMRLSCLPTLSVRDPVGRRGMSLSAGSQLWEQRYGSSLLLVFDPRYRTVDKR